MKKKTLTLSLIASAFAFAAGAHANTIGVHGGVSNFDLGDEDGFYVGVTNQSTGDRAFDNNLTEVDYTLIDPLILRAFSRQFYAIVDPKNVRCGTGRLIEA